MQQNVETAETAMSRYLELESPVSLATSEIVRFIDQTCGSHESRQRSLRMRSKNHQSDNGHTMATKAQV